MERRRRCRSGQHHRAHNPWRGYLSDNLGSWLHAGTACEWEVNFAPDPYSTFTFPSPGGHAVNATDSNSAPYYDYDNDILYVGDDNGYIHQFINVLNGASQPTPVAPSEATGNWPIWMDTSAFPQQTGPIYDSISSRVFAGNINGALKYINLDDTSGDACIDAGTISVLGD